MSITRICPECGYRYRIAGGLASRPVLCPECRTRFRPGRASPWARQPWEWVLLVVVVGALVVCPVYVYAYAFPRVMGDLGASSSKTPVAGSVSPRARQHR